MQQYSSRAFEIQAPIKVVYGLAYDPSRLQEVLTDDRFFAGVTFEENRIKVMAPVIGEVVAERVDSIAPNFVEYEAKASVVNFTLKTNLTEQEAESTHVQVVVDLKVPKFLASMVGAKVQPALDTIADMLDGYTF